MAKTELKIIIGLHRTANAIDRQTARIAAEYDLTIGQFGVLEALYHKGDMTVGEVQEKILSSSGTIPLIINNLARREYLTRLSDENDKRRCILHLTQKGRELISQVYPKNEAKIIEMMARWTDDEKTQLAALLKKFGE